MAGLPAGPQAAVSVSIFGERMGPRVCFALLVLLLELPVCASESDALAISANIQARHFPYSTLLDPIFDSPTGNQIVNYTRCGDSALWTGHYLAAEAFRYKVTGSADALANAKRAYTGIQYMVDVTGNNVLARCLVPQNSPYAQMIQSEEAHNGVYQSPPNFWIGNTSRDQYSGALFGLGVAYDLIDDASLKASISDLVSRMVRFLVDHAWSVVLRDGTVTTSFVNRPDQQLAFLQLARHVNPNQFSTTYDIERVLLSPAVLAPIAFDTLSDDSYFKFNLDSINLYTLIRLESSSFGSIYKSAYDNLRGHTQGQVNAFFNMIDYAMNGANAARDADTRLFLNQWLTRPRRDVYVDNTAKYPSCGGGNSCIPIAVPDRVSTDFIWQRSPYQLAGGGSGVIESAGVDYILPYWMARYYGVIGADDLQIVSSASEAGPPFAPSEIVTIFGPSLTGAVPASASVSVKDSAGVSRQAQIYYASVTQINLVIPAQTALGTASFTIQNPGMADQTIAAEIRSVAPALFSADATGTGAAAATAVLVTPVGQSPIAVFSCTGTTCTTVPIQTGIDTPIYLSLYGTGIRNRSALANVICTVGGISVPVQYAGAQGQYNGLDQVNVPVTLNLRGVGEVDVVVTADGVSSRPVRVNIR
jgi:uncharacterized protein (TIGR03437 family)